MTADERWPFTDVRTAGHRGDLLLLTGTAPDGAPVTITRLAPGAATDPVTHRRFHQAVEEARLRAGPANPRIAWWDTATLSPWAATYNDAQLRGADMIGILFDPRSAPPPAAPEAAGAGASPPSTGARTSFVHRRLPLLIGACAGVAILVLALGVGGSVYRGQNAADPTPPVPSYTPAPSQPSTSSTDAPFGSPSPGATKLGPKPVLRKVRPKSVYGPTWRAGDSTYTAAFAGEDYAFRVPGDFDCFVASSTSEASQVRCLKLLAGTGETRRLAVVNRGCSGRCDAGEVRLFESVLVGSDAVHWKRKDKTTRYALDTFVDDQSGKKYFRFFLSHVYPDGHGRRARHVAAVGEAPVGAYARQIQKTMNDIRTQSG